MDKLFVNFLPPWVETNIQPAFYDKESGSVLQQTARMYAKVNCLVRMFNKLSKETKETVDEYIAKFVELKDFVDTYFENLDVQEEINNKLDAMVEDGTLTELIANYFGQVQYIFPKNWDAYGGDAGLIKAYSKNILIDTHRNNQKLDLYAMLNSNGASHIDYLILTHYHDDHIGNVINLINDGYVDSNSYVYIPADCDQISQDAGLTNARNAIIAALATNNIPYSVPAEMSQLVIDDNFDITFYNTDSAVLSTYTNYNNCSTMCMVRHGIKKIFYTGDALGSAFARAKENGFIDGHVDLFKIEHHGIEYSNSIYQSLDIMLPDFAYQPAFIKDAERNNYNLSTTMGYLQTKGCKIYSSLFNKEYIIFESTTDSLGVKQGVQSAVSSNYNNNESILTNLWVDASTTSTYQDGTNNYPFKDLPQAINACERMNSGRVRIYLKDGTYCNAHPTDATKNTVKANGLEITIQKHSSASSATIESSLSFYNSKVTLVDLDFEPASGVNTIIVSSGSEVECSGCTFDGTNTESGIGIWSSKSKVIVRNSEVSNIATFLSTHNDEAFVYNSTFDTITTVIINRNGICRAYGNTYTSVNNEFNTENSGINLKKYKLIYDGNSYQGTLQLSDDITKYNKAFILTGSAGSGTAFCSYSVAYFPDNFVKGTTYNFSSLSDTPTMKVDASDGTKVTIGNRTASGINIRKIYVIKEDVE